MERMLVAGESKKKKGGGIDDWDISCCIVVHARQNDPQMEFLLLLLLCILRFLIHILCISLFSYTRCFEGKGWNMKTKKVKLSRKSAKRKTPLGQQALTLRGVIEPPECCTKNKGVKGGGW